MPNSYFVDDCELVSCSENSLYPVASEEVYFSNYWKNHSSIHSEVLRGKKLREQKLKSHPVARVYDVVDIDFDKPSCSTNRYLGTNSSSRVRNRKKKRHKSPIKTVSRSKRKMNCPMRIAELAVPTKRHCIETWRNKSETLPCFMVERLRQIIMDEKPVIKIHDALNSFKKQKPSAKSRSENIRKPKYLRNKNGDLMRLMCAMFGYRISRKLLPPLNITLNSDLKAISQIVSDEIALLSKTRRPKFEINNKIQAEIADKVTIWIAEILEDASYNLLLEDFHELQEKEEIIWELIDGLIDNLVLISKPECTSSISSSRSLSITTTDIPVEIPTTHNNERENDKIIETVHLDIVQSILITIVKNIVLDDTKVNIENSLLDTSKVKKTSELIDIDTAEAELINLISKNQNDDCDTNEVKENLLELTANVNGTEPKNKRPIYASSELGFDTTNINETITESESNLNEFMTDQDQHKQSSENVMQYLDVRNSVKDSVTVFQDTNNIELTQNKELLSIILPEVIFSIDGLNHAGEKKDDAKDYIKVANDSAHNIVTDHIKPQEVNENMTNFSAGQMEENCLTPEKDKINITNRFNLQDEAQDNKKIEVANSSEKTANDDVLTTSKEINENMTYFSACLMKENDHTPEKNKMNNTNSFNNLHDEAEQEQLKVVNNNQQTATYDILTTSEEINENLTLFSAGLMEENNLTPEKDKKSNTNINNLQDNNSIKETNNKKQISSNNGLTKAEEVNETMTENSCTPDKSTKNDNSIIRTTIATHFESDARKTLEAFRVKPHNIYFAPPNDHLLSDADEPWPDNLPMPKVKLTLSVSKSVLSLGKITETEEKITTPPEQQHETMYYINKDAANNEIENILQNVINSLNEIGNKFTENAKCQGNNQGIDSGRKSEEENITDLLEHPLEMSGEKKIVTNNLCDTDNLNDLRSYPERFLEPSKLAEDKYTITGKCSFRHTRFLSQMTIVHLPFINISPKVLRKDLTSEKIMQTDKTALKYLQIRVNPTISIGYSAFEDKYNDSTAEYQINKIEVHKWCQGLENVINNLEMWSSWIKNTSTYMMFLACNDQKMRRNAQKWIKLKTDVSWDSALWFKLASNLQTGLMWYRIYYERTLVRKF